MTGRYIIYGQKICTNRSIMSYIPRGNSMCQVLAGNVCRESVSPMHLPALEFNNMCLSVSGYNFMM